MKKEVTIYTDGACSGNPGPGGWGALLQVGHPGETAVSVLAFIAILVASINVFGGFTVTARMLQMFKREDATR